MAAIEWLTQNFTQRHGVPCALDMDEDLKLHEPYATAVFRIVQESLVNVAKHAGASQVQVQVVRAGGEVTLRVADDGAGFETVTPRKAGSLGLAGLRRAGAAAQGHGQHHQRAGAGHGGAGAHSGAGGPCPMIRIVMADDHAIVREGLRRIVASAEDFEVVDEAGDGNEVMRAHRARARV